MSFLNKFKQKGWEEYYTSERKIHIKPKTGFFTSYDIYLCDTIIQKYIPKFTKKSKSIPKICEIGCGDGKLLNKFASMLDCKPYGIEYSKEASKIAKKNGIKVIVRDAFDKDIAKKYKNYFDIIFSYGFIEHIIPPKKAIALHLKLLKPGGYLIIQIPRFKGFNFWKLKLFRPELIPFHNLEIMNKDILEKICTTSKINKIFCSNYGTLKLRLPMDKKNLRYYLLKTISKLDYLINPTLRLIFKGKGVETNFFSPAVIFIGKKKN
jgi:SAM-dependent methyltransferase